MISTEECHLNPDRRLKSKVLVGFSPSPWKPAPVIQDARLFSGCVSIRVRAAAMCRPYIRPPVHSGPLAPVPTSSVPLSVRDKTCSYSPLTHPSTHPPTPVWSHHALILCRLSSRLQDNLKQLIVIPSPNVLLLGRSPYCGKAIPAAFVLVLNRCELIFLSLISYAGCEMEALASADPNPSHVQL